MTSAPTQFYPPGYLDQFSGNRLIAVATVFIAAEIIFVALSFVASYVSQRKHPKRRFRREEWLTVLGLGSNLAMNAISLAAIKYVYAGHHLSYVLTEHPTVLPTFLKMEITFAILYILSITLPKLTMLSLFLRIFVMKWQRRVAYAIGVVLLATAFANIIANVTQCIPLRYLWDISVREGKCIDQNAYWRWASLPNIVTDVLMMALPVPVVRGMMMGWKDKAGVGVTFFAGGLGLITSILRFVAFWRMQPASDVTWTAIELCSYSIAEGGVYLIASCLPAYRALYLTMTRPRNWPSTTSKTRLASGDWGVIPGNNLKNGGSSGGAYPDIEREVSPEMGGENGGRVPIPVPLSPASVKSRKGQTGTQTSSTSPLRSFFAFPIPEFGNGHGHAHPNTHRDKTQLFLPLPWPITRRHADSSSTRTNTHDIEHENNNDNENVIIIQQDFSIEYEDLIPSRPGTRNDGNHSTRTNYVDQGIRGNHIGYQYAGDSLNSGLGSDSRAQAQAKT